MIGIGSISSFAAEISRAVTVNLQLNMLVDVNKWHSVAIDFVPVSKLLVLLILIAIFNEAILAKAPVA